MKKYKKVKALEAPLDLSTSDAKNYIDKVEESNTNILEILKNSTTFHFCLAKEISISMSELICMAVKYSRTEHKGRKKESITRNGENT